MNELNMDGYSNFRRPVGEAKNSSDHAAQPRLLPPTVQHQQVPSSANSQLLGSFFQSNMLQNLGLAGANRQDSLSSALMTEELMGLLLSSDNNTTAALRRQLLEEAQRRQESRAVNLLSQQRQQLLNNLQPSHAAAASSAVPRIGPPSMDELLRMAAVTGVSAGSLADLQPPQRQTNAYAHHGEEPPKKKSKQENFLVVPLTKKERKASFPLPSLKGPSERIPRLSSYRKKWKYLKDSCDHSKHTDAVVKEIFLRTLHPSPSSSDHLFKKIHGLP
jgi:hypothetical protein